MTLTNWVHAPLIWVNYQPFFKGHGDSRELFFAFLMLESEAGGFLAGNPRSGVSLWAPMSTFGLALSGRKKHLVNFALGGMPEHAPETSSCGLCR